MDGKVPHGRFRPIVGTDRWKIARKIFIENLEELLDAQIKKAIGIRHLLMRDPATGKLSRVATDTNNPELTKARIDAALRPGMHSGSTQKTLRCRRSRI